MEVETIKIKDADSYLVINLQDFDPEVHERYGEPEPIKHNRRKKEEEPSIPLS